MPLSHSDEYTEAMLSAMDLIWGEGFMAPGGEGHVAQMLRDVEVRDCAVLDIGCGQGMPACIVARDYGAAVVGTDLEAHLLRRARARAEAAGLGERLCFVEVAPGPLVFADNSFDVVLISGALTQVADKLAMYRECWRVLRPGGLLSAYDWMTPTQALSAAMYRWFELEGLTYELRRPMDHLALLVEAGFPAPVYRDKSDWYRRESRSEYERLRSDLKSELEALLGRAQSDEFIEAWRVLAELCARGELLQVYTRAQKPPLVP